MSTEAGHVPADRVHGQLVRISLLQLTDPRLADSHAASKLCLGHFGLLAELSKPEPQHVRLDLVSSD
jgi:hypothetical protein